MKKFLLIAATLLPATLIALLYAWLETKDSREAAESRRAVEERAAPTRNDGPISAPEADRPAATEESTPVKVEDENADSGDGARRDEVAGAEVAILRGAVRIPAGTPGDEKLEVLLLARDDAAKTAARQGDAESASNENVLARAAIAADGSFEIPSRPDAEWLALRGRYVYGDPHRLQGDSGAIDLEARLGAWITGRVVVPEGATSSPDDVELELQLDPGASIGRAETVRTEKREVEPSSDGTFELRGVRGKGSHVLWATSDDLAALRTRPFEIVPGAHVELELAMRRGGQLAGRIVDEAGKPIAGADVAARERAVMLGQGGAQLRKGQSGEDGRFELLAVAEGPLDLRVDRDGFLDEQRKSEVTEGARTDAGDIVLASGAKVSGRVEWSGGTPAAGVEVEADFDPAAMAGMSAFNAMRGNDSAAVSDAEGRFEISGLGKGPFVVSADASPPGEDSRWRGKVAGISPGRDDVVLVLERPLSVSGRAVDRAGAPVKEFRVLATEDAGGMLGTVGGRNLGSFFEGESGEFRIDDVTPGRWEIEVRAEGFARGARKTVTVPMPEGEALEIVLDRGATVRGIVHSSDGAPFAGASVRPKLALQELVRARVRDEMPERSVRSGAEGRFEITGLAPGAVELVAAAEGFAESEIARIELVADGVVEGVTLRLRTGGTITGEIYGPDGSPLAGAQILAQISTDPGSPLFTNADPAGLFRFEHVTPATYTVLNLPVDRMREGPEGDDAADFTEMFTEMKMTTAVVTDGEETHVVLGAPPKDPVEVSGRVLAGDRPVPKAIVTFLPDGREIIAGMRFITTDEEGRYSTKLDSPGRYMVSVQKQGISGEQQSHGDVVDVPEQERFEHDFRLPLGSIRGRVLDTEGNPAAGVRISLTDDGPIPSTGMFGKHFAEISTGPDGRYELIWLEPGRYTVVAGGPKFGGMFGDGASHGRQMRSGVEVRAERETEDVDFRLRKPGSLEGLVRAANGDPVAEAAIFVRDSSGRLLERFSFVSTDASGRFKYGGLEPGTYTAIARTLDSVSAESASFEIREDDKTEVELALGAGTILLVTLSDDQGNPVECSIEVTDEQGRQVNGTLSMADMSLLSTGGFSTREQRIGPLPPGKYRVIATTSDGRRANKPVSLSGQPERRLNVRF